MSKRVIVIICVGAVAIILGICLTLSFNYYKEVHTFTQSKWLNGPNQRFRIVSSLLANKSFIGMTRKEITEFLGPSDEKYTNGMYVLEKNIAPIDYHNDNGAFYFLYKGDNPDYMVPEDVQGLYFVFDDEERCKDFAIVWFRT